MSLQAKHRINAIAHLVWALFAIVYFIAAVLLARQGALQPDSLKDTLSESVGYAVALVLFIIFYAVGIGIGVIEAIVHGIVRLKRVGTHADPIWLYIILFLKAGVLADCTFLSYLMGKTLLPDARAEALFFLLPLGALALCEIDLFGMDLWIHNHKSASTDLPFSAEETAPAASDSL